MLLHPSVVAALVSACVSLFIVVVSRWVFQRGDRRFPILKEIQSEMLGLYQKPPEMQDMVGYVKWPKISERIEPILVQLSMVSFPVRNCAVQKAWRDLKADFTEERGKDLSDGLSTNEFKKAVSGVLVALAKG